MWWRVDFKNIGSIDIFKEKIVKGEFLENDIFLYERVKMEVKFMFWECKPIKKDVFEWIYFEEKPIDFFGIGEGECM